MITNKPSKKQKASKQMENRRESEAIITTWLQKCIWNKTKLMKTKLLSLIVDWRRPVLVNKKISKIIILEKRIIRKGWGGDRKASWPTEQKLTWINVYHGNLRTESVQNKNMNNWQRKFFQFFWKTLYRSKQHTETSRKIRKPHLGLL